MKECLVEILSCDEDGLIFDGGCGSQAHSTTARERASAVPNLLSDVPRVEATSFPSS